MAVTDGHHGKKYRKGDVFGDLGLMFGGTRDRSVVADTDVKLWALPYEGGASLRAAGGGATCGDILRDAFDAHASVRRADGGGWR